jgi:hypothetical protein
MDQQEFQRRVRGLTALILSYEEWLERHDSVVAEAEVARLGEVLNELSA